MIIKLSGADTKANSVQCKLLSIALCFFFFFTVNFTVNEAEADAHPAAIVALGAAHLIAAHMVAAHGAAAMGAHAAVAHGVAMHGIAAHGAASHMAAMNSTAAQAALGANGVSMASQVVFVHGVVMHGMIACSAPAHLAAHGCMLPYAHCAQGWGSAHMWAAGAGGHHLAEHGSMLAYAHDRPYTSVHLSGIGSNAARTTPADTHSSVMSYMQGPPPSFRMSNFGSSSAGYARISTHGSALAYAQGGVHEPYCGVYDSYPGAYYHGSDLCYGYGRDYCYGYGRGYCGYGIYPGYARSPYCGAVAYSPGVPGNLISPAARIRLFPAATNNYGFGDTIFSTNTFIAGRQFNPFSHAFAAAIPNTASGNFINSGTAFGLYNSL